MNFARYILCALVLVLSGCDNTAQKPAATTNQPAAGTFNAQPEITGPQGRLQTLKLYIGSEEVTAELARTIPQITTGMMFRTNMIEMDGMLFVFNRPHQASFWMRNTLLPLSCAYIDPDGMILEIHDMKPKDETPIPAATDRIQYVLEMKQGWFDRHNIKTNTLVRTERGTLGSTFSRQ